MCDADFSWVDFLFQGMSVGLVRYYQGVHEQWNTLCVPNCLTSCCSVSSQVTWVSGKSVQPYSAYPLQGRQAWEVDSEVLQSTSVYPCVVYGTFSACLQWGLTWGLWHKPLGSVCEISLPPSVPHVSHLDAEQTKCGRGDSHLLLWNSSLLGCEHTGFPIGFFLDVFLSLADNLAHCWGSVLMFGTNE